jgi:hypothetical protein
MIVADLRELIEQIEALGTAPEEIAKEAANDALRALREKTAAGRDIEGKPFAPRKDGTPYADVSSALSVTVSGASFVVKLASPSNGAFFQNRMMGHRENRPRRQILPFVQGDPEPKEAIEAIERAIERVRQRKLGG